MSSLLEVKLFKNNKWKTMLPLTGFSLCKPNIYNGWRHTLSLWRIRYKLCRRLVCYHCLNNSETNTFQLKASLWYSLIFIDFRSSSSCLATWYKAKDQCLACLITLKLAENIKWSAIQLVCGVSVTKFFNTWRSSVKI